jgi:hypothetical protein
VRIKVKAYENQAKHRTNVDKKHIGLKRVLVEDVFLCDTDAHFIHNFLNVQISLIKNSKTYHGINGNDAFFRIPAVKLPIKFLAIPLVYHERLKSVTKTIVN